MASIKKFTDLLVWQKAHSFVLSVYKCSETWPAAEIYGLTSQLRRSVVSITSNIAEGFDRGSNAEFKQFLIIARASVSESQNQLLIARDLGFMNKDIFNKLSNDSVEIHKMINGLIKTLKLKNL